MRHAPSRGILMEAVNLATAWVAGLAVRGTETIPCATMFEVLGLRENATRFQAGEELKKIIGWIEGAPVPRGNAPQDQGVSLCKGLEKLVEAIRHSSDVAKPIILSMRDWNSILINHTYIGTAAQFYEKSICFNDRINRGKEGAVLLRAFHDKLDRLLLRPQPQHITGLRLVVDNTQPKNALT